MNSSQPDVGNTEEQTLDTFGQWLMQWVRDKSLSDITKVIEGRMKGASSQSIHERLASFSPQEVETLKHVMPFFMDMMLGNLMWALEQTDVVDVAVHGEGNTVESLRTISDGLAGELYGEHGWIAKFSTQPYVEE